MVYLIEKKHAIGAHRAACCAVLHQGTQVQAGTDYETTELHDLIVEVTDPLKSKIPLKRARMDYWDYIDYQKNFVDGRENPDVEYTYGNRMKGHFMDCYQCLISRQHAPAIISQAEGIKTMLWNNKDTRQAVINLYDPRIDLKSENPPCLDLLLFLCRGDKLYTTGIFRSHDIYAAWLANFFGIRAISLEIAEYINMDIGSITILSHSAHIYKRDYMDASMEIMG